MPSRAYGYCDKTGFRYPLADLKEEYENGRPTGRMVGKDVYDEDHPQNFLHTVVTDDPKPLPFTRPDLELDVSRAMASWDPVGYGNLLAKGKVGRVTVETD